MSIFLCLQVYLGLFSRNCIYLSFPMDLLLVLCLSLHVSSHHFISPFVLLPPLALLQSSLAFSRGPPHTASLLPGLGRRGRLWQVRGFSSVRLVPEGGGGVRRDGTEAPRASARAAAVTGSPLVPSAESAHSEPTGPRTPRPRARVAARPRGQPTGGPGYPGKPQGPGAVAARPRPGRTASAYRCSRPGHAESGAAGSRPAPDGCQSRGGPGRAGVEGGG